MAGVSDFFKRETRKLDIYLKSLDFFFLGIDNKFQLKIKLYSKGRSRFQVSFKDSL